MKFKITLISMVIILNITTMEEPKDDGRLNSYPYFSFQETQNADDVQKNYRMRGAVFMHLVVQAEQSTFNQKPFQELLQKIKNSTIKTHGNGYVYLTKKDCEHRLLTYIMSGHTHRFHHHWYLVNGMRTEIDYYAFNEDEVVPSGVEYYVTYSVFGNPEPDVVERFIELTEKKSLQHRLATLKKERDQLFITLRYGLVKNQ